LGVLSLVALVAACDEPQGSGTAGASVAPIASARGGTSAPASAPTASAPATASPPMMVHFTRDYCLACQVMKPWISQLRGERGASLDVVVVNIDRPGNQRFAQHFVVEAVPAQVFVGASGRVEARHEGVATLEQMTAKLDGLGWMP